MLNIVECDINRQSSESSAPTVASGGSLLTESSQVQEHEQKEKCFNRKVTKRVSHSSFYYRSVPAARCPGTELQSALVHALVPLATRPLLFSVLNDTLYAIISITK